MKHKVISNDPILLKHRPGITIDNNLKNNYQKALNSPFMKRKVKQAEAFIAKHGLPDVEKTYNK